MKMVLRFRILRKFQKQVSNGNYLRFLCNGFSTHTVPSKSSPTQNDTGRMTAWQIHSYGTLEELQFSKNARYPTLMSPNEVLVKVLSTSVNPIDVLMISGYGSLLLNTLRQLDQFSITPELEFPLIMGRDCCGQVLAKGNNVGKNINIGDIVYGVVPVHLQGCHAEQVVVGKDLVRVKPEGISIEEAGSVAFAAMTAWCALKVTGDLWVIPAEEKNVLVIGASGGVGTIAIQLLKCWGAKVVAVCSTDAMPVVSSLKPDHIIDYKKSDSAQEMSKLGKYDIILDAAGVPEAKVPEYVTMLKDWSLAKFITLKSPFLRNVDQYGLFSGIYYNAKDIVMPNLTSGAVSKGSSVRWAFFMPIPNALDEIHRLLTEKRIKPVVQKVYKYSELPEAYKKVQQGHSRGKIVVKVN